MIDFYGQLLTLKCKYATDVLILILKINNNNIRSEADRKSFFKKKKIWNVYYFKFPLRLT